MATSTNSGDENVSSLRTGLSVEQLYEICSLYKSIKEEETSTGVANRKLLFYATCKHLLGTEMFDKQSIDSFAPYGSLIGMGNSWLDTIFKYSKLLRVHAALHDAYGLCRAQRDVGPGYCYMLSDHWRRFVPDWCILGHVTGLTFLILVSIGHRNIYKKFDI